MHGNRIWQKSVVAAKRRLQRQLRQGGTGGDDPRSMRPSLRVQQSGRGSIGLTKEGPMAKVVNGLGRRALPSTSEVKGRVLFERGRHLSMQ